MRSVVALVSLVLLAVTVAPDAWAGPNDPVPDCDQTLASEGRRPAEIHVESPRDLALLGPVLHLIWRSRVRTDEISKSTVLTVEEHFVYLKGTQRFQRFLAERHASANPTTEEQSHLILDYSAGFFSEYAESPKLLAYQAAALSENLRNHGWPTSPGLNARANLERLSAKNRGRLEPALPTMTETERTELTEIVDALQFTYRHNTKMLNELPKHSLVSSRQLLGFGIPGGANSKPFNREFMKTDDNVYFHVNFRSRRGGVNKVVDGYGDFSLYLDPAYADRAGMTSHFVMYPSELNAFASLPDSQSLGLRRSTTLEDREDKFFPEIREQLHRADFTALDFRELVRRQLVVSLHGLKKNNPEKFEYVKALFQMGEVQLTPQIHREFEENYGETIRHSGRFYEKYSDFLVTICVRQLALTPLGISPDWELTVPVAVPPQYLRTSP